MKKKVTSETLRVHVFYTGRVQGVGFRYTAERLALERNLVGWVQNLPDGRVELVCEGSKGKINEFLQAIRGCGLGRYIQKAQETWETPTGEFMDFRIEFYQ